MLERQTNTPLRICTRALLGWKYSNDFRKEDLFWFVLINTLVVNSFVAMAQLFEAYVLNVQPWLPLLFGVMTATPFITVLSYLSGKGFLMHTKLQHELEVVGKELEMQANQDFLTGLANRRAFSPVYEQAWNNVETDGEFAFLTVDLDGFKIVNDQYGHAAGDAVLVETSNRLRRVLESFASIIVRLGGDEFAALVPYNKLAYEDDALRLGRKLCFILNRPFIYEDKVLDIGASVGIATTKTGFPHRSALAMAADEALLAAKASGKGQVTIYQRPVKDRQVDKAS